MCDKNECSCSRGCGANPVEGLDPVAASERPLSNEQQWFRSRFRIPGMDCPSEEQMIRLRLADVPVRFMVFDIPGRTLVVGHAGDVKQVIERLVPLGYGAALMESQPLSADTVIPPTDAAAEARVLRLLLGINALMFLVEMVAGFFSASSTFAFNGTMRPPRRLLGGLRGTDRRCGGHACRRCGVWRCAVCRGAGPQA